MDGRKQPISRSNVDGRSDADAAPTDSGRESSSVIYFGDPQRIAEGFAIALHAMGAGAPRDIAPPDTNSNREDN
jgi:hypothetical protein